MAAATQVAQHTDYTASVYGSLLVTTMIAAQWQGDPEVGRVALSLAVSIVTFWLAHTWAGIVNLRTRGAITRGQAIDIAVHEAPMLVAAVLPTIALSTTRFGMAIEVAFAAALAISIVQLFLWGLAVGRAAHSSWPLALLVAAIDCSLGIVVVILKLIVIH